jgi:uncharacterized protein YjaG (DUF416 family)
MKKLQPKKFIIHICCHCEYVYLGNRGCPKCDWPSYSASWVYNSVLISIWRLFTQRDYKENIK